MPPPRGAQQRLGIPADFKPVSAFPFTGMNQAASRIAIDDTEFYWLENFIKIDNGNLRTLWDAGQSIYTAPTNLTIISFFWYNIGATQYVAVFLSDGSAFQVRYPDGQQTQIAGPNTFFLVISGQLPACCQSGTQYLIISNNNTQNDYWIWDGTLLYAAGGIAPIETSDITDGGSGYTSAPAVTVFGGTGFGVVLTPVIAEGSVVALTVNNAGTGYSPGDVVQVAFSGGGSDSGAILQANLATNIISHITLLAGGNGYPTGTFNLQITGGGGTGAAGTFTTANGSVTSILLTNGGSGYVTAPTIQFPIPGSGASITATESVGQVNSLTIVTGGSGYVPGTYPLVFTGGGGGGAQATYTVNLSGVVASTTLVAGGTGYTSNPTVTVPTGSGAAAVALLNQGKVASVAVLSGGSGFVGTPTLTFQGGQGSGAQAVATVSGGSIVSVAVTNGGTGYETAPAVIVETGVNNAAAATLDLMPFGVSGSALETYQSRVWISFPKQNGKQNNGGTYFTSAPNSLTDFATSDGGNIFVNSDRFLRQQYTFLRQTSNFLYAVGDSSVSVVSNVQTGGSPTSTTFSYQNTDPQVGTSWRDTAQDFANTILFANAFGVYGVYGGSVKKVSKKVDNIFTKAVLPPAMGGITPSSAVANIFSQKVYLLLLTITDPFSGQPRNVMLFWNEKEWFVATQQVPLTYIATREVNSNIQAWGTDGNGLYPLFQNPSASLVKVLSTKMYGGDRLFMIKAMHSLYISAEDKSSGQNGLTFTGSVDAHGLAIPVENSVTEALQSCPSGPVPIASPLTFMAPLNYGAMYGCGVGAGVPQAYGVGIGMTLASSSPDFVLQSLQLGLLDVTAVA